MSYIGFTERLKKQGKTPLYSTRSIIKGITDKRYLNLCEDVVNWNYQENIKIYSLRTYEPDEVKSQAEKKRIYSEFIDWVNYCAENHMHSCTDQLCSMTDPKSRIAQNRDWPFCVKANDIGQCVEYATDIIILKKNDPNY